MQEVDQIHLNFNEGNLSALNFILAFIMFGVALEIKADDFIRLVRSPKIALVGLASQFVILPAATCALVYIIQPAPSIALGMIMVAACPGGNISNFITYLAKGNTALSVSLTAVGTVLAIVMTPFNLSFWGGLYSPVASILHEVSLDAFEVLETILLIAGLPLLAGMFVGRHWSAFAALISRFIKPFSIVIFLGFVAMAFTNNVDIFTRYIHLVLVVVFFHNAVALASGFYAARIFGLEFRDQKTVAIETGIQNSGLGLLLIFSFFGGLGGAALVAAWWGIWHIISGMLIATFWGRTVTATQTS
ncbi:MAG TPA: bile acid:sodium symporter family protein [Cyclobacteriaceae bacterium]|nr:bile acid:sodium symporter family protein [Cyclobacteriaceae bacterium]